MWPTDLASLTVTTIVKNMVFRRCKFLSLWLHYQMILGGSKWKKLTFFKTFNFTQRKTVTFNVKKIKINAFSVKFCCLHVWLWHYSFIMKKYDFFFLSKYFRILSAEELPSRKGFHFEMLQFSFDLLALIAAMFFLKFGEGSSQPLSLWHFVVMIKKIFLES